MDFPFHGIPTVPPRKDMTHLVSGKRVERKRGRERNRARNKGKLARKNEKLLQTFFCRGCRYRVTAEPSWTSAKVKRALWTGGISRSNREDGKGSTPGVKKWEDLVRDDTKRRKECFFLNPRTTTMKRKNPNPKILERPLFHFYRL